MANSKPTIRDFAAVTTAVKNVGIRPAVLRAAFLRLAEADGPVEVDGDQVASATLAQAERDIVTHLVRLTKSFAGAVEVPDHALRAVPFEMHPDQKAAIEGVATSPVTVVTGGPGRGKTAIIQRVLDVVDARLCAPTGKASLRMSEQCGGHPASTIHRLLKFHPECGFRHDDGLPQYTEDGVWVRGGPIDADTVVVDETSMVDTSLFAALLRALPDGCRLVIVGDVDQLPSIGPGRVLHDLIAGGLPTTRLTKIFRQAEDSPIPYLANAINEGDTRGIDEFLGSGVDFAEESDVEALVKLVVQRVVHDLPAEGIDRRDIQVLAPQKNQGIGVRQLNLSLKAALNPSESTPVNLGSAGEGVSYQCHVGDKVIQTSNNYQLANEGGAGAEGTFNGEIGYVVAAQAGGILNPEADVRSGDTDSRNPIVVVVDFGDRTVAYTQNEARELHLAYCVTGHKYQGSQAPCIVIPVHSAHQYTLTRQWLYTAVTRASERLVLLGERAAVHKAAGATRGARRGTKLAGLVKGV